METEHRADLKGKAQRPCGQAGDQHVPLPWAGRSGAAVLSFATRNHPPGSEANGQPGPGSGRLVTWVCCLRDSPWVGSAGSPPHLLAPLFLQEHSQSPAGVPLCACAGLQPPRRPDGHGESQGRALVWMEHELHTDLACGDLPLVCVWSGPRAAAAVSHGCCVSRSTRGALQGAPRIVTRHRVQSVCKCLRGLLFTHEPGLCGKHRL